MAAKFPIDNKLFMEYDSDLVKTGVLYGEVNGAQIACTHLTSYHDEPYQGNHGSWEGQNAFEAKILLGLMKSYDDGETP